MLKLIDIKKDYATGYYDGYVYHTAIFKYIKYV